jgi:predicted TIM-barrel fold metal-dependent hydrolase
MSVASETGLQDAWRLEAPGHQGWARSPWPGAAERYFLASVDTLADEPFDFWTERIEPEYRARLPRMEADDEGAQWLICEGCEPQMVRPGRDKLKGLRSLEVLEAVTVLRPYTSGMDHEDEMRSQSGAMVADRLADLDADGIDATIIFPNKGGMGIATPDPLFSQAMCRAWNRWAVEEYFPHHDRLVPMAMIAPADVVGAIAEVQWAADVGFHGLSLPVRPVFGSPRPEHLQYNDQIFDPLWAAIAEADLPVCFHVSSGMVPRRTSGRGGAVINYVCNSMATTIEPLVQLINSGVFERHAALRAGSIESGIGWVPWVLDSMDYAFRAHHMWVRPVIPELPSHYYRMYCFSTFVDDPAGLALVEPYDLVDNFLWSNDYPRHEGSFPHSAQSIERQLQDVTEETRTKLLGLNAARVFSLSVPRHLAYIG